MDMLLRIVRKTLPRIDRLLDLGCGDGILGRAVLTEYPDAAGVFLDFSEPMIEAACQEAAEQGGRATFIVQDFGAKDWTTVVVAPFDLVVSGFAIHHQPDERKRELYQEIFELLKPGGLFLNQEHVASKVGMGRAGVRRAFRRFPVEPSSEAGRHKNPRGHRQRVLLSARQGGRHPGPPRCPVPLAGGDRLRGCGLLLQAV